MSAGYGAAAARLTTGQISPTLDVSDQWNKLLIIIIIMPVSLPFKQFKGKDFYMAKGEVLSLF